MPVWWAWVGYTNYADRFDSDDLLFRLLMLGGMLGITIVAVAIPDTFQHGSAVFGGAYAAVRLLLIVLYARARRHVPEARALCAATISVFIVGTALWIASLAVPEPWRFAVWGVALAIEGSTPWIARRAMASVPYHVSHLPERYGLFTLIVLGESLVAVVIGIHGTSWRAGSIAVAAIGFLSACALWWIYFDSIDRGTVKQSLTARNTFIYGHLLIAVGLAMTGVGIKLSTLHAGQQTLPAGVRWALCGGAALFLIAMTAVRAVAIGGVRDRLLATRALACAAIIACGAFGGLTSPLVLNVLVSAVLFSAVVADVLRLTPDDEEPPQLASDPPLDRDAACRSHTPTRERDLSSGFPSPAAVE